MGLEPISPLAGALLWATTAIGEGCGAAVWYMVAEANIIATAAPYVGYAAITAAFHNIHKILLVLIIQSNICMQINTIMTEYISHYCINICIW